MKYTIVTIISIVGSIFSTFGVINEAWKKNNENEWLWIVLFIVTCLFCAYYLFFPVPSIKENVKRKLDNSFRFFSTVPKSEFDPKNVELFQEGEFMIGKGELSIEFECPYAEPPQAEILNIRGYENKPTIKKVTSHQIIMEYTNYYYNLAGPYRWIARGKPLYPIKVAEILNPDEA